MGDLEEKLDLEILTARMHMRAEVQKQLAEELEQAVELEPFTDEDRIRSSATAKSLASALALAVLILMRQNKPQPVKLALSLEDYRLRRAAATETSTSYALAHLNYPSPDSDWVRRWDATLDTAVCKFCAGMDGTLEPWADGALPGYVHINCRCIGHFIKLSLSIAA